MMNELFDYQKFGSGKNVIERRLKRKSKLKTKRKKKTKQNRKSKKFIIKKSSMFKNSPKLPFSYRGGVRLYRNPQQPIHVTGFLDGYQNLTSSRDFSHSKTIMDID